MTPTDHSHTNPFTPHLSVPLPAAGQCTGCGACERICPFGAISMGPDAEGFLYPRVNFSLCRNCGLCGRLCPANHRPKDVSSQPQCYAVWAEDEVRRCSSSGGVFTLLARQIFKHNGVVYGAAFEPDWSVKHRAACDESQLAALRGSKYVQSNAAACFAEIRDRLEKGQPVLFTGTPCQVAGLHAFLQKEYAHLITADCVCHGVPNNEVWQKYLSDNFDKSAIASLSFRDKAKLGWQTAALSVYFKDGSHTAQPSYVNGFNQNLFLRPACAACSYTSVHRMTDFTLADFWGIDGVDPSANDLKGTSLLLVHTPKARQLLEQIRPHVKFLKEYPLSALDATPNYPLRHSSKPHEARASFFREFRQTAFNALVDKLLYHRFEVGVVGPYTVENYGNNIQYYSLYQAIRKEGYTALMIERPQDALCKPHKRPILFKENPYAPEDMAPLFPSKPKMGSLNKNVKSFLVGSDQIFRGNLFKCFGEYVSLDWVDDIPFKSVYGLSFGLDFWDEKPNVKRKIARDLKRFNKLSFRESSGQRLMQTEFGGLTGPVVLDPVFLLDRPDFEALIRKSDTRVPPHSLFCYILDKQENKTLLLEAFAKEHRLTPYTVTDAGLEKPEAQIYVEDWIKIIAESEFVLTDSFHGMCMAIIFQKQFFVICNAWRGTTRFVNLLEQLGLTSRIVETVQDILKPHEPIDYREVNIKLRQCKEESLAVLRQMLQLARGPQQQINYSLYERVIRYFTRTLYAKAVAIVHRVTRMRYTVKIALYRMVCGLMPEKKKDKIRAKIQKTREKRARLD